MDVACLRFTGPDRTYLFCCRRTEDFLLCASELWGSSDAYKTEGAILQATVARAVFHRMIGDEGILEPEAGLAPLTFSQFFRWAAPLDARLYVIFAFELARVPVNIMFVEHHVQTTCPVEFSISNGASCW